MIETEKTLRIISIDLGFAALFLLFADKRHNGSTQVLTTQVPITKLLQ